VHGTRHRTKSLTRKFANDGKAPIASRRPGAGRCVTENLTRNISTLFSLGLLLTGCAVGGMPQSGPHLSPTECRDLAALKTNASPTKAQSQSELSALRKAGYDPSPWNDDPNYPDDLHAAQRLVDHWFETDCQRLPPG
jgi:hypothetical protein